MYAVKAVVDLSITSQNYRERDLLYLYDIQHDIRQDITNLEDPLYQYVLSHGGVLGIAHHPESLTLTAPGRAFYALYIPRRLNMLIAPQISVRSELSPDSASDLGFKWVQDINRYEPEKGLAAGSEWLSIYLPRVIKGYSLGVPRFKQEDLVGLYRPLKTNQAVSSN
jgi:hypothetical protein